MLRYAFRRVLWVFPSVLAVSLLTFFVLSRVPGASPGGPPSGKAPLPAAKAVTPARESRSLPLFFNIQPRDVRSRVAAAVQDVVEGEPGSERLQEGQRNLARLGGVALPLVVPKLDALVPTSRVRLALALAPLAERMGLVHRGEPSDPKKVVRYWIRFWETHGIEFRQTTAKSAVRRYRLYGTRARADQLRLLDTFALPVLMDALPPKLLRAEQIGATRRLVGIVSHMSGRSDRIAEGADVPAADACLGRWKSWWMVHRADYVELAGASRVAAFMLETRYGKWVLAMVSQRLGKDAHGRPILHQLWARTRVSLTLLLSAWALAYLLAVPLGTLSAAHRGRAVDRVVAIAVLAPFVLSPAVLSLLVLRFAGPIGSPLLWAVLVLVAVMLADPTRQQRAELLPVLAEDYVRAARARGAGPLRVLFVHGVRNALLPLVTRGALELPVALTASFVVERVFGLEGLGEATVLAVRQANVAWLMVLAMAAAVWAVLALVITDAAYALLDPRLQSALTQVGRRRA